jgi:hypothetical protein
MRVRRAPLRRVLPDAIASTTTSLQRIEAIQNIRIETIALLI